MAQDRPGPEQIARFKRLAWPCVPVLLRTARYLTQHDAEAEDLVQDTMLKAMRFIDRYEDGTDIKAWLMTILRRTHIDHARAQQRHGQPMSIDDTSFEPAAAEAAPDADGETWRDPDELLNRFEDQAIIDALKQLPEPIRWTLLLVDVEQMDHSRAAEVLDVPEGTIKSRAFRGRRMLREHLASVARRRGWVEGAQRSRS